jgi:hypothetical protein
MSGERVKYTFKDFKNDVAFYTIVLLISPILIYRRLTSEDKDERD